MGVPPSGRSLREEAIRTIRAGIVYGELEPGRIHSASQLAGRMGISVTPVREAMLEMVNRGMVAPVRNRGFMVIDPTRADLDATLELRMLVEAPTIGRLAGRLPVAHARAAEELVDGCLEAARVGELPAFLDLDRRFHLLLLQAAGNRRTVELVDRLRDRLRFEGFRKASARIELSTVAEGHRLILRAVLTGAPQDAESAMREHLLVTRSVWHEEGVS
jgi:DNA-binding GntR family transcriptional regulator